MEKLPSIVYVYSTGETKRLQVPDVHVDANKRNVSNFASWPRRVLTGAWSWGERSQAGLWCEYIGGLFKKEPLQVMYP